MVRKVLIICLILSVPALCVSQEQEAVLQKNKYSIYESLITLFPSFFVKNVFDLKDFIRSDEFLDIRKQKGDPAAVDNIFEKGLELTKGNTGIALLISTIATLDHYTLGIRVPLLNIHIPLTHESKSQFNKRLQNLPAHIFSDSPKSNFGDKDKLQHIFGSAFLTYVFDSDKLADRFSIFVEKVEDNYIRDGQYDDRDLVSNTVGQNFGFALMSNQNAKPSDILNKTSVTTIK